MDFDDDAPRKDDPRQAPRRPRSYLLIVVLLNLTAIVVRNRLRKKYRTSAFA